LSENKLAKVLMYATAVCPYCIRAEQLLNRKGITDIEKIRVDLEPQRRDEMLARSNGKRTVPQIFIGETHVGGCDDLHELDRQGKLDPLLAGA
jgi:glutaredoxin 3